jgi:DNA polymerase-3 subunit epsilon
MSRQIVFDTETTGIETPEHRLIELGCVELLNLMPTGREFHAYINPQRDVPADAVKIHGLTTEFLRDFPTFSDPSVVDAFFGFVGDATLVAHNASFDARHLNAELSRLGRPTLPDSRFIDTLKLAQRAFPGSPASLSALCRRFEISDTHRELHGAIKDARLLAEVYLELNGGRAAAFAFDQAPTTGPARAEPARPLPRRPSPRAPVLTDAEAEAHAVFVTTLGGATFWKTPAAST